MIKINQITALSAELLFNLADHPRRAVADRVHARIRPEARPNRALEEMSPGDLHAAFDPAAVDRRAASLGMGQ